MGRKQLGGRKHRKNPRRVRVIPTEMGASKRTAVPDIVAKPPKWGQWAVHRFAWSLGLLSLGLGSEYAFHHVPVLAFFEEAVYRASQESLQRRIDTPACLPVVVVDLGFIPKPNSARPPADRLTEVTSYDDQLDGEWTEMARAVRAIAEAKPKAIVLDADLSFDKDRLVNNDPRHLRPGMNPDAIKSYNALLAELSRVDQKHPVLVMANAAQRAGRPRELYFSKPIYAGMACHTLIPAALVGPYNATAFGDGPDGEMPSLVKGLSERLAIPGPEKGSSFLGLSTHAHTESERGESPCRDEAFWVDFGAAPALITQAEMIRRDVKVAGDLRDPKYRSLFQDRIVVLADVADPAPQDNCLIPLPGTSNRIGGGILHACAVTTLLGKPLYAVSHGAADYFYSGLFGLIFAGLAIGATYWWCKTRSPDPESRSCVGPYAVAELVVAGLSVGCLFLFIGFVGGHHVLSLSLTVVVLARVVELVGTGLLSTFHLLHHHEAASEAK